MKLRPKDDNNRIILQSKKPSALLRVNTFTHNGDFFYCLNYSHSFVTENKLELHEKACENKDLMQICLLKTLKYYNLINTKNLIKHHSLFMQILGVSKKRNNAEIILDLSARKVSKHIPSCFSMSTIYLLRSIENKHDVYKGKDCIKKFCGFLAEQAIKIIFLKMKLLTKEEQGSYGNAKICIVKLKIIVIIQESTEVPHIAYVI